MFVNFSGHPSAGWSDKQKSEAQKYGEIVDVAFPDVMPETDEEQIDALADKYVAQIIEMKPDAVMCQGEYSLTFNVALKLMRSNITFLCACTERCAIYTHHEEDAKIESLYSFVKFRKYSAKGVSISE